MLLSNKIYEILQLTHFGHLRFSLASPSLLPRFSLAIAMLMSDYVSTLKVG